MVVGAWKTKQMAFDIESLVNGIVNVNLFLLMSAECVVDDVTCRSPLLKHHGRVRALCCSQSQPKSN
jgi:hypothetical protein